MAFKKVDNEISIPRFKEFDEARVYIEDFSDFDKNIVFSAIDYMLIHKEYYFLLKNISLQFSKDGGEEIIDYLFSRLDCVKRNEDKELIKNLLYSPNRFLSFKVFVYILDCCDTYSLENFFDRLKITKDHMGIFLKHGECEEVRKYIKSLKKDVSEILKIIEEFEEVYIDTK